MNTKNINRNLRLLTLSLCLGSVFAYTTGYAADLGSARGPGARMQPTDGVQSGEVSQSTTIQNNVSGHCVAAVANTTIPPGQSGENPLFGGDSASLQSGSPATQMVIHAPSVTGPGGLGAVCNHKAVNAFNANASWSNPAQFCAHYPDGKTHKVQVLEILTEVGGQWHGHTGGYNLVAGYTVTCAGPINVTPLTVPVVVSGPF